MNRNTLKHAIGGLSLSESRYYCLKLYDALHSNLCSPLLYQQSAPIFYEIVCGLKSLESLMALPYPKDEANRALLEELTTKAQALYGLLVQETLPARLKALAITFLSYVLGSVAGLALGVVAMFYGASLTKAPLYFTTGFLVGALITSRLVQSLESQSLQLFRMLLSGLKEAIASTQEALNRAAFYHEREHLLQEWFADDECAKVQFCQTSHPYQLIGFKASFLSYEFKGMLGHHALIYFEPKKETPFLIELGTTSLVEAKNPDQVFVRTCSGETLLNMAVMHRILQTRYAFNVENIGFFIKNYRAALHDCHTYVDIILASTGEALSPVERSTKDDNVIGQRICKTLQFFSPYNFHRIPTEGSSFLAHGSRQYEWSPFMGVGDL